MAAPRGRKPGNAPLESLAGGSLAARFHAWRGDSGHRYICSVFPANAAEPDASLPDFADAVVMAVAADSDGMRRIVSLCHCETGADSDARDAFVAKALAAGAVEWHVHLLATDVIRRRAVIGDIVATRRGADAVVVCAAAFA